MVGEHVVIVVCGCYCSVWFLWLVCVSAQVIDSIRRCLQYVVFMQLVEV